MLKAQISNLGAYDGKANGDLTIDASTANPTFALRADLTGVRALPLLQQPCRFRQARRQDAGEDQRALHRQQPARDHGQHQRHGVRRFQDGAIRGLNVAQMIRSLTSSTLSGWQESKEQATDLTQLSASFKIDKGQAQTTDLNLVGPLVRMTGAGTIDLDTKQIGVPGRAETGDDHRRPGPRRRSGRASAFP